MPTRPLSREARQLREHVALLLEDAHLRREVLGEMRRSNPSSLHDFFRTTQLGVVARQLVDREHYRDLSEGAIEQMKQERGRLRRISRRFNSWLQTLPKVRGELQTGVNNRSKEAGRKLAAARELISQHRTHARKWTQLIAHLPEFERRKRSR